MKPTYSLALIVAAGSMLTTITPLRASEADQVIDHEIFELMLANDSLAPGPVKFQVVDGVVTITGATRSLDYKAQLDNVIADLDGVQSVVDNRTNITTTEVNEPESAAKSMKVDDHSLTYQVKSSLMFHNLTSDSITQITSTNGVVTITGVARTKAEKRNATLIVGATKGVTGVFNNMAVAAN